jgi:hypothetical protein
MPQSLILSLGFGKLAPSRWLDMAWCDWRVHCDWQFKPRIGRRFGPTRCPD